MYKPPKNKIMNNLTRYVSAAVYKDGTLRSNILDIYENKYKAIAEPHGLDLDVLSKHCYKAQSLMTTKNIFMFLASITLLFPVGFLVSYIYSIYIENKILRGEFSENKTQNNTKSSQKIITQKSSQISKNVIYYDGFSPFVGAGVKVNSWSFAIDTDKPEQKGTSPKDFKISEIYELILNEVKGLNFQNLEIFDRLVINGSAIRENKKLLPNQLGFPLNNITEKEIKSFMDISNKNARYYQLIQIKDWDDELILSIYLRFYKNDRNLFVESTYYVLTPLKEEYKSIKSMSMNLSFLDYWKMLLMSLFTTVFEMIGSVFYVYNRILQGIYKIIYGRYPKERKSFLQAKRNPDFNYGTALSIRELVASKNYQQYFQVLDKDMYLKIIEKRVLNTITSFLESKNINTSEFKERETQLLNNGIIITGGNVNAKNIAVGKKATIKERISKAINTT